MAEPASFGAFHTFQAAVDSVHQRDGLGVPDGWTAPRRIYASTACIECKKRKV